MEIVIDWLSNPIVRYVMLFGLGIWLGGKNRTAVLKLAYLLIEAVEVVDSDIQDVISDKKSAKMLKIKHWIARRVKGKEKKLLDRMLNDKGLAKKKA